jgi:SAM-dependent methyltransferase
VGGVRLADLGRTEPVSRDCARERGTPVDAYYEERFLTARARNLGEAVLHLDRASTPSLLPRSTDALGALRPATGVHDAVVCRGVLEHAGDPVGAVALLRESLRPGGTLLATLSGIGARSSREEALWGFTPASASRLFAEGFRQVSVTSFGNVRAAVACVQGIAAEELGDEVLAEADPDYPVVIGVFAVRSDEDAL